MKGADDAREPGAREGPHLALLADQAARQRDHDVLLGVGSDFGVCGRRDAGQLARDDDECILEAAARPEERRPRLQRPRDRRLDRVVVGIGAARHDP